MLNFNDWMTRVNRELMQLSGGFDSDDLPDVNYRDMYKGGYSVKEAAAEAMEIIGECY